MRAANCSQPGLRWSPALPVSSFTTNVGFFQRCKFPKGSEEPVHFSVQTCAEPTFCSSLSSRSSDSQTHLSSLKPLELEKHPGWDTSQRASVMLEYTPSFFHTREKPLRCLSGPQIFT